MNRSEKRRLRRNPVQRAPFSHIRRLDPGHKITQSQPDEATERDEATEPARVDSSLAQPSPPNPEDIEKMLYAAQIAFVEDLAAARDLLQSQPRPVPLNLWWLHDLAERILADKTLLDEALRPGSTAISATEAYSLIRVHIRALRREMDRLILYPGGIYRDDATHIVTIRLFLARRSEYSIADYDRLVIDYANQHNVNDKAEFLRACLVATT